MKKIFFATLFIMLAFFSNAQLTVSKSAQSTKDHTVYKWGGTLLNPRIGTIMYVGNVYVLYGTSTNKYASKPHSIILGENKEQAIASLNQLSTLSDSLGRKDNLEVMGTNEKTTTIFKVMGNIYFATSGVAGEADCLYFLKFKEAIKAIEEYDENK